MADSQNSLLARKGKSTPQPYRGSGQRSPLQSLDQPFHALEDHREQGECTRICRTQMLEHGEQ